MAKLDARGIIAAVEIGVYAPILITSLIVAFRHGLKRSAGWIFLVVFSIVRIVGAALHIAWEFDTSNNTLRSVFLTLQGVGLTPLLMGTLGFLETVAQGGLDKEPSVSSSLKALGGLSSAALALTIGGGVIVEVADSPENINRGRKLQHASFILFNVLYVLIVLTHILYWAKKEQIRKYRRILLAGISLALPFLGVRVVYGILNAYSPVPTPQNPFPNAPLSKFNILTGEWGIYLAMSVIMEFIVVLIYTVVGVTVPLRKDLDGKDDEEEQLKKQ